MSKQELMAPQSIHVFDLDHTLVHCNSSVRFINYLYCLNVISLSQFLYIGQCYGLHKLGFKSIGEMYDSLFNRVLRHKSSIDIARHAEDFVRDQLHNLLHEPIVRALRAAQQQGAYTVILSCSSNFLVAPIAKLMGVNEWGAVTYNEDTEKRFTSVSLLMDGEDKARYVLALIDRFHLTMDDITAYTDSYHDLPLLRVVGNVVCVNPDKKLKKEAMKNSWKIV